MTPPTRRVCQLLPPSLPPCLLLYLSLPGLMLMYLACAWMRLRKPTNLQHMEQGLVDGRAADEARANKSAKRELRTESSMKLKHTVKQCESVVTSSFQLAAASRVSCCVVQKAEVFVEEARQVGLAVGMHAPAQQSRVNACLDHAMWLTTE